MLVRRWISRWRWATLVSLISAGAVAQDPCEEGSSTAACADAKNAEIYDELSVVELIDLDLPVSTGTRMLEQPLEEAPSIVYAVTRNEIDRFGYRTLGEALASVPGLFVVDDFVTSNITVRGISAGPGSWSRTLKFMINGQPVQYYSTGGALAGPEFIPMDAIERIEVVRGPASATYGANAFLGVVNVITRDPHRSLGARLTTQGGAIRDNLGVSGGATLWGESSGKRPLWILGSLESGAMDRSGLEVPDSSPDVVEGQSEGDRSRPTSAFVRAGWDGDDLGRATVQAVMQRTDAHAAFATGIPLSSQNRVVRRNDVARVDYHLPLLDYEQIGAWEHSLELHGWTGVSFGRTLPEEFFSTAGRGVHRERENITQEGGFEVAYAVDPGSLVLGLDYLHTDDTGDTLYDQSPEGDLIRRSSSERVAFANWGTFGQLVFHPFDAWSLTGSLRWDHNDRWGDNVTYRLASVNRATEWLNIKLLYGTSYVPPAPTELSAVPLQISGGIQGNPELMSQRAETFEVALLARPRSDFWADVTAFLTNIEDRVEIVPVGQLFRAENQTASRSYGVETAARYSPDDWVFYANLAIQETGISEPDIVFYRWEVTHGEDAVRGNLPPNSPQIMSDQRVAYAAHPIFMEFALSGAYVGARKSTVDNSVQARGAYLLPAYYLLGAHIRTIDLAWLEGRSTDVSLHAENLLGANISQPGIGGVDLPVLGRSIFLRYSQEL